MNEANYLHMDAEIIHFLPAVRKYFDSDLLPNELVSVAHLKAKSLAQTTQSAGAVAPGHSWDAQGGYIRAN